MMLTKSPANPTPLRPTLDVRQHAALDCQTMPGMDATRRMLHIETWLLYRMPDGMGWGVGHAPTNLHCATMASAPQALLLIGALMAADDGALTTCVRVERLLARPAIRALIHRLGAMHATE